MLKTNWVRCIWAICIMTGESLFPEPCLLLPIDPSLSSKVFAVADGRVQFLLPWKSGSLPRLPSDYQGILELRRLQGYYHQ
jgi:hypothetical protein